MVDKSSLSTLLLHATTHDASVRVPAEKELSSLEQSSFPVFATTLCGVLGDPEEPPVARHLAGILLKNTVVSKDPSRQSELHHRWVSLPSDMRSEIKVALLNTLASPLREARDTAAMIVAKIAAAEIPRDMWPELIDLLLHNISITTSEALRQSTFKALGFVCEECPDYLQSQSGSILSAIAQGMDSDQNNAVKLAATTALISCLEFANANMRVKEERDLIMSMILSSTRSDDVQVRVAAFSCLVQTATIYYDQISSYMQDVFVQTRNAIVSDSPEVSLLAIEVWSSICDEEIHVLDLVDEARKADETPGRICLNLARTALPHLAPLLLECLTKQSEDEEPGDCTWNVATAAGLCVSLMAAAVRDDIVAHILPFVEHNIKSSAWRDREAATLAFGSILEGPSIEVLKPLVSVALPVVLVHLGDTSSRHVRDTAAWTIGRICKLVPDPVKDAIGQMMHSFLPALRDIPSVASHVCWAIHSLASVADGHDMPTSMMSSYFEGLVGALLDVSLRTDVADVRLLRSSYEAINELVLHAAKDCDPVIDRLLPNFIERLQLLISIHDSPSMDRVEEAKALLCGSLQTIIMRSDNTKIHFFSDQLMVLLLSVLRGDNGLIHEEALLAIAALADSVQADFLKYMESFRPCLVSALKNTREAQICQVAVGVVSELCRALGKSIIQFSDELVQILLEDLQSPLLERTVKPHIISCLGDVALALRGGYARYLGHVMNMLIQASTAVFDKNDPDAMDDLNFLRQSILEAYTAVIAALADANQAEQFVDYIDPVLSFLDNVASDPSTDVTVLKAAIGVIGDLVQNLGRHVHTQVNRPSVGLLLKEGLASGDRQCVVVSQWAHQLVQQLTTSF